MILAMAAEAARQYLLVDETVVFSLYGINTIIAETALLAAVGILFLSANRTAALAQLFALVVLAEAITIAVNRQPQLALTTGLVAAGLVYFSRNRTAVIWKLFALAALVELAAFVVVRLPVFEHLGMLSDIWWARSATILFIVALLVWWIGAIAAMLRSSLDAYRRPLFRALGFAAVATVAIAALPAFPVFVDSDFDPSSSNLWEWGRAKFAAADREPAPRSVSNDVELSQPALMEAEVGKLRPERKGKAGIYTIGVAGWADQDVFIKELNGGLAALDNAIGLDRGTLRLVNHFDTTESLPIASRTNFASAVHSIAKIMDKDDDILLIFITSHGGPGGVALNLRGAIYTQLSPDQIATVLDREGIKNRLIIISACYSGVYVERLASPDSVVLTAADANSPSFGCSNERDWTYFGDALFNQNLAAGVSLEHAFEKAKATISQWEARDGVPPSNPQGFFGAALSEKLHARLNAGEQHHALAGER
jgi:hypothetical protein